ncbi:MAG: hypothetical protein K9M44_02655 [Candidatus Pacebacteria bacterium]|nr:hypothetical protein [Candidatus Paceibacterota bacterium]
MITKGVFVFTSTNLSFNHETEIFLSEKADKAVAKIEGLPDEYDDLVITEKIASKTGTHSLFRKLIFINPVWKV